jgi:hypothetical protein
MRRGITLQYLGSPSGYATATTVYHPDTPLNVQLAYAKSYVSGIVSGSGSGFTSKVEVWVENFQTHKYVARYPNNLGSY